MRGHINLNWTNTKCKYNLKARKLEKSKRHRYHLWHFWPSISFAHCQWECIHKMLADRNKRFSLSARNSIRNISIWIFFKYTCDNTRHEPITTLPLISWLQNKHRCFQIISFHQGFSATMNKIVLFENVSKVWQCNSDQHRTLLMSLNASKGYQFSIHSFLFTFYWSKIGRALQPYAENKCDYQGRVYGHKRTEIAALFVKQFSHCCGEYFTYLHACIRLKILSTRIPDSLVTC